MASFAVLSLLAATVAGRVRESGNGGWWSALELAQPVSRAQVCSQAAARPRDLVFELIELEDSETVAAETLATSSREVVRFDWNPATGELTYDTSAPTSVFSDLVIASPPSTWEASSCGSQ